MTWTDIPDAMRLVDGTGAAVLRHFPETPVEWLDLPDPEQGTQRARLDAARHAWTRLCDCWVPGAADMAGAPTLVLQEVLDEGGAMFFVGRVFGHPLIEQGHLCHTSLVIGFDGERVGWARTISRWYRLQRLTLRH